MTRNALTILHIQEGEASGQEASDRGWTHQLPVGVEGTQGHGPLTHMHQTLGDSDQHEVLRVAGMVNCQLTEHGTQTGVVCSLKIEHNPLEYSPNTPHPTAQKIGYWAKHSPRGLQHTKLLQHNVLDFYLNSFF